MVRLGCSNYLKQQTKEYTVTTNTFDLSVPSTWVEIIAEGTTLGATMETTYDRRGSQWKHIFKNNFTP